MHIKVEIDGQIVYEQGVNAPQVAQVAQGALGNLPATDMTRVRLEAEAQANGQTVPAQSFTDPDRETRRDLTGTNGQHAKLEGPAGQKFTLELHDAPRMGFLSVVATTSDLGYPARVRLSVQDKSGVNDGADGRMESLWITTTGNDPITVEFQSPGAVLVSWHPQ